MMQPTLPAFNWAIMDEQRREPPPSQRQKSVHAYNKLRTYQICELACVLSLFLPFVLAVLQNRKMKRSNIYSMIQMHPDLNILLLFYVIHWHNRELNPCRAYVLFCMVFLHTAPAGLISRCYRHLVTKSHLMAITSECHTARQHEAGFVVRSPET